MNRVKIWNKMDCWTWREMIALLALEFIFVVCIVKYPIQAMYENWLENTLYSGTLTGLTIAVTLMLGLYFIAIRPKRLSWTDVGLTRFPVRYWWRIVLWLFVLIVLSLTVFYITSFFGNTVENAKTESLQQNVTIFTMIIAIVSAGIVSPIYEEIFYRGFIYRWLRGRIGIKWAIVISALIFSLAHYPTTNVMPVTIVGGIVFAWSYERTGSIIPAIIIHSAFNVISVLLTATG